jgi:hypothetical protein
MRARRSTWSAACLAAGLALSLAAVGCGDDDDGSVGGSGGSSGAKAGGTGGKGGSGGASGKGGAGGTGGSSADPAKCATDTAAAMKDDKSALSNDCVSCICNANAKVVLACTNVADNGCWAFLACYADHGCTDANQGDCITANCSKEFGATGVSAAATAIGPVLSKGTCAAKCVGDSGNDAGTHDAGF